MSDHGGRRLFSSLRHFWRAMGYVWPLRRYWVGSVVCVFLVAATYAGSISSLLPILKAMVEQEGLHGWIWRETAEDRLATKLETYEPVRHGEVVGVPLGSAVMRDLKPSRSPLYADGARDGDLLIGPPAPQPDTRALSRRLATASAGERLRLEWAPRDRPDERHAVDVAMPETGAGWRVACWVLRFIPEGRLKAVIGVLVLLLGLQVIGGIASFCAEYLTLLTASLATLHLRRRMYRSVLSLPVAFFSRHLSDTSGRFVQDMQDIYRGIATLFTKTIREPLKAAMVFAVAIWLDWKLTLIVIAVAPASVMLIRFFGRLIRKANRRLLEGYGRMLGALEGALTGIRVVKAYNAEVHERRRLFGIERQMLRQMLRMARADAASGPVIEVLGFLGASIGIVWLAQRVIGGALKPSDFITLVAMLAAMFDPIRRMSNVYNRLQRADAAAERVFALIDMPGERDAADRKPALPPPAESIVVSELRFTYPQANRPALDGVDLSVRVGQTIAIVGPNGSGKTTLIGMLLRFFEPDAGRVLVDGRDVREFSLASLRRQFAFVAQDPVIFADSVTANIAYGNAHPDRARVEAAARRAFADEFVRELPDGYDTVVGEHGATLSGGQKQRIAIARAIYTSAPVLIFDEATSQVDADSEQKIHKAIDAMIEHRTALIIAHRFSTIRKADRIAVMDAGKIVAIGRHEQLIETCPLYRVLYETQFEQS